MAAITIVSGHILMNTYENSVSEARFELMPAHHLQTSLREAEHLTYLYAIEGDRSAPFRFKKVEEIVNREFQQLTESTLRFASVEHAHSSISVSESIKAWKDAQAAALQVFQFAPNTIQAVEALRHAHVAIDPVYDAVAEFHRGSMEDLQERLKFARSLADQAYSAIFGAIMIGLGVLIVAGFVVSRSVLQPIEELQRAARRLSERDFSHRVRLSNTSDELGQLGRAFNIATATLQRLYGELEQRSTHDGLTGALNRAAFDERLSAEPGDILARYGGEEFIIILPETDEDGAMAMAERVRKTVEGHSFDCPIGDNIRFTVSVGCANRRTPAMASEDLVKVADAALYQAKKTGRNRVVSARELPPASSHEWKMAAA